MLVFYKNKGILVPVYFVTSVLVFFIINALLKEYAGIAFRGENQYYVLFGIACIASGVWTYVTRDSYYITNDGIRKPMNEENTFYFLPMKTWAYIFYVTGVMFIFFGLLENFLHS